MNPSKFLHLAAFYLMGLGLILCIWPFASTPVSDGASLNVFATIKYNSREFFLATLLIAGGLGIFLKQAWARKVSLTALAMGFFYGGNKIAWLLEGNAPTTSIIVGAYALSFLIFGVCFFLLFKNLDSMF